MADGFIKDYDLIQETSRVEDLLDFSENVKDFSNLLDSVSRPSLIGLIGKFGAGKSTMLFQVQNVREQNETWINFDAWKYPDRKDLWEGFVLDFADQLGGRKRAKAKLDGTDAKSHGLQLVESICSDLSSVVPGLKSAGSMLKLFKSSPAKRVFEIQEILKEIIEKHSKDIVIVVEDVDRSGDKGIYFLETLREFVTKLKPGRKVLVVVPIGTDKYASDFNHYLKCLDYASEFTRKPVDLTRFVDAVMDNRLFEGQGKKMNGTVVWTGQAVKGQITSFCEFVLQMESMTIRQLKMLLRNADLAYRRQVMDEHEPDWRVTIGFEAAKHVAYGASSTESLFHSIGRTRIVNSDCFLAPYFYAMIANHPSIYEVPHGSDRKLIRVQRVFDLITRDRTSQEQPSFPWHFKPSWPDEKQKTRPSMKRERVLSASPDSKSSCSFPSN